MIRSSLATPLVVTVAGAALLAANLHPAWSTTALIADGWPWLLVLWGAVRCSESVWARLRGRPAPDPAEGAALLVAVLVAALGSAAHSLRSAEEGWVGWSWTLGRDDRRLLPLAEQRFDAVPALELRGFRGRLVVSGGPSEQVRIRGGWRTAAGKDGAPRGLDVDRTPDALVVQPGLAAASGDEYRLEIDVPAATRLRLTDCRGELTVEGLRTEAQPAVRATLGRNTRLHVEDVSGGLAVSSSVERLELTDVRGPVQLEGNLIERLEARNLDGPFELVSRTLRARWAALPGRCRLTRHEIELEQVAGPLEIEARAARVLRLRGLAGAGSLFAQQARLELSPGPSDWTRLEARTEQGDIRLALDPTEPFRLEASARGGRIEDRLSSEHTQQRGRWLQLGAAETDAPAVELETQRGMIVLEARPAAARN